MRYEYTLEVCFVCGRGHIKLHLYNLGDDNKIWLCKVDTDLAARFRKEGFTEPSELLNKMYDWRNYHPIREQVERTSKYDKNPVLQIGK